MDGSQKCSRILLKIFSDELQAILMCGNLENLRKTFCIGKKSDFNFQKVGFFGRKKGSPILLKTFSDEVQVV